MITGDHPQTAMSIGQMLGITNSSQAMTGYQLEHMDDAALAKAAVEYDIFARTSPEHKLRLVKALQDNGEVVGMTGDGVTTRRRCARPTWVSPWVSKAPKSPKRRPTWF